MRRFAQRAGSPAMAVAVVALVAALAGTAVAERATTAAMSKKKVKKIATKQINRLAPGLSVAHADTADTADSADTADTADSANTADSADTADTATSSQSANTAANATRLGGVTLAQIAEVDQGFDDLCEPPISGNFLDCTPGAQVTTTHRTDILVTVTATWYSDEGIGADVETNCRLEENDTNIGATATFGTNNNDTQAGAYERSVSWSDLADDRPPGTYTYEFSCRLVQSDSTLNDVYVHAVALPG